MSFGRMTTEVCLAVPKPVASVSSLGFCPIASTGVDICYVLL